MEILPKADDVVIPIEKFTHYILNAKNSNGKHVAFERALGYSLRNYSDLIENIRHNIKNFPAKTHPDKGHGTRYSIEMTLRGANGKTARVITAWINDNKTNQMRLTSAYVKKSKERM